MVFDPAFVHNLLRLIIWQKAQQSLKPAREECDKYDLIVAPYFWLVNHNDWCRWFAISSLPTISKLAVPILVLWVGRKKSK